MNQDSFTELTRTCGTQTDTPPKSARRDPSPTPGGRKRMPSKSYKPTNSSSAITHRSGRRHSSMTEIASVRLKSKRLVSMLNKATKKKGGKAGGKSEVVAVQAPADPGASHLFNTSNVVSE